MANNVWDIKTNFRVEYFTGPGGVWSAIQADSYQVDIDRGITVEESVFARPDVGIATVQLMKSSLSALVSGSPYAPNQPFRISYQPLPDTSPSTWEIIFYGFIQNVGMSYNVEAKKLGITIVANDAVKILLNTQLSSFSVIGSFAARSFRNVMSNATAPNNLNYAINAVDSRITLAQNGSGASNTTQWAWTWLDTPSGEIINQFLDAELGWAYASKDSSTCYYYSRTDLDTLQAKTWNTSNPTVSNIHTSSILHYCMDYLDLSYDCDTMVNKARAIETTAPSIIKNATNSSSVTAYGEQRSSFEVTFDTTSGSALSTLQQWVSAVVASAADPKSIRQVSCPALRRDGTVSDIAKLDVGQTLQVEFSDGTNVIRYPDATAGNKALIVSRINHSISADHWEMTVGLWKGI